MGEALKIVASQLAGFDKTLDRLDLLGLDRNGKLVVIELKRDDSSKSQDLQALRYAAYCSTLRAEQVVDLYRSYERTERNRELTPAEARKELEDFIRTESLDALDEDSRRHGDTIDFEVVRAFIGSIPKGRWSSYGDVAAAAGAPKGGQALGTWLSRNGQDAPPLVYRVLTRHGEVSPGWRAAGPTLPSTAEAVQAKLADEGIEFDANGRASQDQRWTTEDWGELQLGSATDGNGAVVSSPRAGQLGEAPRAAAAPAAPHLEPDVRQGDDPWHFGRSGRAAFAAQRAIGRRRRGRRRPEQRRAPTGRGSLVPLLEVETAGIEPASAVAPEVTSTSVSGALVSPPARLAGGVAGGQPPEDVPGSARADLPG